MNNLFNNKRKNIIAIIFTAFYIIMLILNFNFRLPLFQNFRYVIKSLFVYLTPMIAPVFILVLIFTYKKEYKVKTWLLPIAFCANLILSLLTQISNIANIKLILSAPDYLPIFLCSFLICVAFVLMFLGTLFDLKYIKLLKHGALGHAILSVCSAIIDFINVGGFAYIQSVPAQYSAVNIFALIQLVSCALFYIGIFILTSEKKLKFSGAKV